VTTRLYTDPTPSTFFLDRPVFAIVIAVVTVT
jgi:hypothetical protein